MYKQTLLPGQVLYTFLTLFHLHQNLMAFENIVAKGGTAYDEQFLLLLKCF